jgi:hypothetical protein
MEIKFFKTKKNFKKKSSELDPDFYWKLIVFLTFLMILASFIFGYYTFIQVKDESISSAENIGRKKPVEKERIEKVLEHFSLREEKSAEILNSPASVVDPSL